MGAAEHVQEGAHAVKTAAVNAADATCETVSVEIVCVRVCMQLCVGAGGVVLLVLDLVESGLYLIVIDHVTK